MKELTPISQRILEAASWFPERKVDFTQWTIPLSKMGYPIFPEVERILACYGGLDLDAYARRGKKDFLQTWGEDIVYSRGYPQFIFDPLATTLSNSEAAELLHNTFFLQRTKLKMCPIGSEPERVVYGASSHTIDSEPKRVIYVASNHRIYITDLVVLQNQPDKWPGKDKRWPLELAGENFEDFINRTIDRDLRYVG